MVATSQIHSKSNPLGFFFSAKSIPRACKLASVRNSPSVWTCGKGGKNLQAEKGKLLALVAHVRGTLLLELRRSPTTSFTSFKDGVLRVGVGFCIVLWDRGALGHLRTVL
jgi:hypothetical protein